MLRDKLYVCMYVCSNVNLLMHFVDVWFPPTMTISMQASRWCNMCSACFPI